MSATDRASQHRFAAFAPWAAWAAMTVAATWFVFAHASRFPYADDVAMLALKRHDLSVDWNWLWTAHNDHRLPLVRLCMLGLLELGGGDFRAPLVLHIVSLALISAVLIAAARELRGRPSVADAFFPLVWMSWGNAENLLWSHQLQMTLTSVGVMATVLALARTVVRRGWLALAGLCTLALPLCGGGGVAQAPVLACLLLWSGLERARSDRPAAVISLVSALATFALSAWYFVDLEPSLIHARPSSASEFALAFVGIASLTFGALPSAGWAFVGSAVLVIGAATCVRELRGSRTDPRRRALLFGLLAQFALLTAMASSRSDPDYHMRALRYGSLLYPLASAVYLSWALTPVRFRPMEFALCASALAALPGVWGIAAGIGRARAANDALLLEALRDGASSAELARLSNGYFISDLGQFTGDLATMRRLRMGPFRQPTWSEEVDNELADPFETLVTQPIVVHPRGALRERQLVGRRVLCGPPPAKLVYAGPTQPTRLLGECGLLLAMAPDERKQLRAEHAGRAAELALVIEVARRDGSREVLLRRELRVADKPAQQRIDLDLAIPAHCARVELRYETTDSQLPEDVLPYWHGIELRP